MKVITVVKWLIAISDLLCSQTANFSKGLPVTHVRIKKHHQWPVEPLNYKGAVVYYREGGWEILIRVWEKTSILPLWPHAEKCNPLLATHA